MTEIRNYDTADEVAAAAAENAIEILSLAIANKGNASWVLAGGTSPMLAYKKLVADFSDALDWSKVTILIGDERYVPLDDKDSNWGTIVKIFDKNPEIAKVQRLVPDTTKNVIHAAIYYESLMKYAEILEFDLVWIGVGEDGHTLSLFPGNAAFTEPSDAWVIPVFDSPKPPAERFSLSLTALQHVDELVIFAVGAAKKDILKQARLKGKLPISVVADTVEEYGGEVRWLYDDAAWDDE